MTGKAPRIKDYLEHVLSAIDRIENYTAELDQSSFAGNTLVQDAVIRNFEIIGEAASRIIAADPGFTQRHRQLPLDLAYRMRNALIHGYDTVNLATVWNTVQTDLPTLKQKITDIAAAL